MFILFQQKIEMIYWMELQNVTQILSSKLLLMEEDIHSTFGMRVEKNRILSWWNDLSMTWRALSESIMHYLASLKRTITQSCI